MLPTWLGSPSSRPSPFPPSAATPSRPSASSPGFASAARRSRRGISRRPPRPTSPGRARLAAPRSCTRSTRLARGRARAAWPLDLDARWALPADRVLFLLPAGIRPVKAPLRPLGPFDRVVAADPRVRLLYVGPVLDPVEGRALAKALAGRPWARHLGPIAHAAMPSLLARADVVLHC